MFINEKFSDITRRMIYEYHRIELDTEKIDNYSVIELIAQKTCISIKNCEECMHVKLEYFNCSWCFSSTLDSNGPFCSDEQGLHRRRQEWIERKCDKQVWKIFQIDTVYKIDYIIISHMKFFRTVLRIAAKSNRIRFLLLPRRLKLRLLLKIRRVPVLHMLVLRRRKLQVGTKLSCC